MRTWRPLPRWRIPHIDGARASQRQTIRLRHNKSAPQPRPPNQAKPRTDLASHFRQKSYDASAPKNPSSLRRLFRGILYVGAFGASGFFLTWGWKTWAYLQAGRSISEPAVRHRNKQWFDTQVDRSSLVQSLREENWIEEDPADLEFHIEDAVRQEANVTDGHHLVNQKLVSDGHLVTKHFRHPTDGMTVLVFMADLGCESWPNTLHGGVATTVIQEALNTHVKNFPEYAPIRNRETTMNYRLPLNPATLYSVFVRTDGIEYPYQSPTGVDKSFMGVAVEILLNEMDRAPRYIEKFDEESQSNMRVCSVHNARKGVTAYVKGGSILFLASKEYRDRLQDDPDLIPALRQKRDAWLKAYESTQAKPRK